MIDTIYTISVINRTLNSRCIGYYFNFEDAKESVLYNNYDMADNGYYNYAVIEKIREGLYREPSEKHYFEYTVGGMFKECDEPEILKDSFHSFGIGC